MSAGDLSAFFEGDHQLYIHYVNWSCNKFKQVIAAALIRPLMPSYIRAVFVIKSLIGALELWRVALKSLLSGEGGNASGAPSPSGMAAVGPGSESRPAGPSGTAACVMLLARTPRSNEWVAGKYFS